MAPNTTRTISVKTWNFPVEPPSLEYKFDIKEYDGSMFNAIIQKKACGQKHPGRLANKFTYFQKPTSVFQVG